MVQCYPGRAKGGDRKPTEKEVQNCAGWLDKELRLINPAIVVLFGTVAARHFFKKYLCMDLPTCKDAWGKRYEFKLDEKQIFVFAVQHPAYRRRKPEEVDETYRKTGERIRESLSKLVSYDRGR